jgi:hypothetical protein
VDKRAQLPLLPAFATDGELVRLFEAVVERVTLKCAAYDLDQQPSRISNAITGVNHNHIPAEWLGWAVRQPGGLAIVEYLAALAGHDVVPMVPMEPAEELAALLDAVKSSLSPDMASVVIAKAKKRKR